MAALGEALEALRDARTMVTTSHLQGRLMAESANIKNQRKSKLAAC
jgi:hypothetical protein